MTVPSDAPGLPTWPGIDETAVATTCAAIARRFMLANMKSVGLLPAAGSFNLGPLLVRLATALAGFGAGKVGVIPRWGTWSSAPGEAGALRLRAMGPNVVAIVPPAAPGAREAALALQPVLWGLPAGVERVLVDLSGYTKAGGWPGAGVLLDGVAIAVPARIARRDTVEALLGAIPEGKNLGTILIG